MKFTRTSGNSAQGPADRFTGTVFIDTVRNADTDTAIGCAHVRLAPGARTAWHTHPNGQTLYATDGIGLVSRRGSETTEIRPGGVVCRAGRGTLARRHPRPVHGPHCEQEADDTGQGVTWLEHVTDKD